MIRPSFIREYHNRDRDDMGERWRIIHQREDDYRKLNEEYGVVCSTSYHGQADPDYDRRYREIAAKIRPIYDAVSVQNKIWLASNSITISEFLYVDNFSTELLVICARSDFESLGYFSFIEAKASLLINNWKKEFTSSGVRHRLEDEMKDFRYAKKRCLTQFSIKPWDINAKREIRLYRRVFSTRIHESLDRLMLA